MKEICGALIRKENALNQFNIVDYMHFDLLKVMSICDLYTAQMHGTVVHTES